MTFPLEDCSEFRNFVITLIYIFKTQFYFYGSMIIYLTLKCGMPCGYLIVINRERIVPYTGLEIYKTLQKFIFSICIFWQEIKRKNKIIKIIQFSLNSCEWNEGCAIFFLFKQEHMFPYTGLDWNKTFQAIISICLFWWQICMLKKNRIFCFNSFQRNDFAAIKKAFFQNRFKFDLINCYRILKSTLHFIDEVHITKYTELMAKKKR